MKHYLFALAAALLAGTALQAQAYEGTLKVNKVQEPAIVMVYNFPADIVEHAFRAKLTDQRLKGSKSKGFLNYSNSVISDIYSSPLDYSFRFDQSGKKGKEKTTVYLLMRGSNTLAADPPAMARNAKAFMESAMPHVEQANTISLIKKQEEILVKEEKKMRELKSTQSDLEKKLEKNKREQSAQEKVLHSQKTILDDLKSR